MNTFNTVNKSIFILLAFLLLFILFPPLAKAESSAQGYVPGSTGTQLAWWFRERYWGYGPRYYRPVYYRPAYYGPRCNKTCFYNRYGRPVNCATRCVY